MELIYNRHYYDTQHPPCNDLVCDDQLHHDPYNLLLRSLSTSGCYSEMMIVFAACTAVLVAIQSYCPPAQHVLFCVTSMNRTIRDRGVSANTTPAVTLMWTMTQHLQQPKDFIPNHFVVLHQVETGQVETELSTSFNVSLPLSEVADQVSETSVLCSPLDDIIAKRGGILVDTYGFT